MRAIDRRTIIKTGAALAAGVLVPAVTALTGGCAFEQSSASARRGAAKPLPARGEFVVRGATVLTMGLLKEAAECAALLRARANWV